MSWEIFALWLAIGIFLDLILKSVSNAMRLKHKTFHVHHSILGIFFIVAGFFIYTEEFVGLGTGIILAHSIRLKRIVFFEKVKEHVKK